MQQRIDKNIRRQRHRDACDQPPHNSSAAEFATSAPLMVVANG
jgi:hypothetical protein